MSDAQAGLTPLDADARLDTSPIRVSDIVNERTLPMFTVPSGKTVPPVVLGTLLFAGIIAVSGVALVLLSFTTV